ncbi:MAG TPA: GNAT family N-acetyltransferase [Candidatus Dormibacteraeota bacterium]
MRRAAPDLAAPLAAFFGTLEAAGDTRHFHPHAMDAQAARAIAGYAGPDLYYALLADGEVLGYGLLRGWEEGYEVPSLGIAIHPSGRGRGLGRLLMEFLHSAARERGARRIRLRVHPDNVAARRLYDALGYAFEGSERGEDVGWLDL